MEQHSGHITHIAVHRDDEGKRMGMWLFLFTEVLLFAGLFAVYAVYRFMNSEEFHHGSAELNLTFGAVNTIILLTSSLTVAISITALQEGKKRLSLNLLYITLIFALAFLVNKYFEYGVKYDHGLFPWQEHFKTLPHGEGLFFVLYFFMTALHGLHILAGMTVIGITCWRIHQNQVTSKNYTLLENAGLYWHLVDIIWIFLFPLLYLII
jgi:cytochrome c oxidase subunit 3